MSKLPEAGVFLFLLCLVSHSHLASGEDFWVWKAQGLRETVNRMIKPLNRVDVDLLSGS